MKHTQLIVWLGNDYPTHSAWYKFWQTLRTLNRRAELQRLIRWARRKHLRGPLRVYQRRLEDEELELNRLNIRYPGAARWAYRVYRLNNLLFPTATHHSRGATIRQNKIRRRGT